MNAKTPNFSSLTISTNLINTWLCMHFANSIVYSKSTFCYENIGVYPCSSGAGDNIFSSGATLYLGSSGSNSFNGFIRNIKIYWKYLTPG